MEVSRVRSDPHHLSTAKALSIEPGYDRHDYATSLDEADVLISAEVLQPTTTSTTLVPAGGGIQVQDGPYADTKDRLGGTIMIEVPDLDAALAWAEKCPSAQWGPIEIRPSAVCFADGAWVQVA